MTEQFKEQGGAATMDPSAAFRWLSSQIMSSVISPQRQIKQRQKAEKHRHANGGRQMVEYFHQVEEGYSPQAAEALGALGERYDIELRCDLVGGPTGNNAVEPEALVKLAQYQRAVNGLLQ